jgi:hypothetical protein
MRTFFDKFNKLKEHLKPHHWNLTVSHDERNTRLEICNSCEFFNSNTNMCASCGCHIPSKSLFHFSECPQDKWPIKNAE